MPNIPTINPNIADPGGLKRRQRGEQLLDLTRQWMYSRMTRRANLARHKDQCLRCRAARECRSRRVLGEQVEAAEVELGLIRLQLAELDAEAARAAELAAESAALPGTIEMF